MAAFNNFIEDICALKNLGLTPLIIHGGGPRINNKLEELNIKSLNVESTNSQQRIRPFITIIKTCY